MINKLQIENFRSHKNTSLDFVSGVNVIWGLPDSGKTNVIRSLIWLLTNRPLGFRFNSNFSDGNTKVTATFTDGNIISLTKSKKSAEYQLNDSVMKALGSDVPDVITTTANMTELNLQKQLSQPFLITASPSEVTKTFNRITRLEKVDAAVSVLTTDINTENKKLRQLEVQESETQKKIDTIGDIDSMVKDHALIKKVSEALAENKFMLLNIGRLVTSIESEYTLVEELEGTTKGNSDDLDEMEKMATSVKSMKVDVSKLSLVIDTHDDHKQIMFDCEDKFGVKLKELQDYLETITECPYCENCKTPAHKHNLGGFIKEFNLGGA